MILEALVALVATALSDAIGLLPTVATSPFQLGGLATIVGDAKGFDAHLPITESLAALAVVIAYFNASVLYHLGNWVYRHIPFVS